ncbi:poly(A) polymerase pla1, putative [Cordyceps militaris CM01]|uniref:Putative gamma-glutamylcyclotransferase n=1 Tax=Cordyceps militaris (strain CM01) TaxID=983644 RepID=G3J2J0_CORMM|nr:poly(A) polymerase pla1, putative [Cordyceps militaris CM01]EGX95526.1 poly(A) polymerase pla1, putative [Cordyceps militaris CM01]
MSSSVIQTQTPAPAPAPPPPPPPLPPSPSHNTHPKKLALKVRSASPGWSYQSPRQIDYTELKTGPYFFYGTLMDPGMLAEILKLSHEPILRPAKVFGYTGKLWGQYPAVVEGEAGATVCGAAYNVESVEDARKLAAYETCNYQTKACKILYTDGEQPEMQHGRLFVFAGNPSDLETGAFDLSVWLKRVGR